MNICIPVNEDSGLESPVCAHFGSAPMFLIVDAATGACRTINNQNQHHQHGMCQPLAALNGEQIDGIVVGGIGMGALSKLMSAGIQVYLAEHPTAGLAIEAWKNGTLSKVEPGMACGGHGHGAHGCGGHS